MKKTIALSLFIALFGISTCFSLQAQSSAPSFGLKAGLNLATIADNNDLIPEEFDFTNARFLHGGIFWNKAFDDQWGLGIELLYNQKGGQNKLNLNPVENNEYKLRFDYLSLPLLVRYRIQNLGIEAGAELSYRVNLHVESDQVFSKEAVEAAWSNKADTGLLFGLSYQIKNLLVTARYNFGITNLAEFTYTDANGEPIGEVKHWNRVLQLSVGYLLF